MHAPLVSIIIPTYNSASYVVECLESVLSQTFTEFEVIIIDDHSEDDTVEVVKRFDDPRIRLIELSKNVGPAGSRNAGIEEASGRFMAFLDSDDRWHPRKLEIQLREMIEGSYDFTYTLYDIIDQEGRPYAMSGKLPGIATYADLLPHCFIRTSSIIYDTHATGEKILCPDIRKRQDFGLFLAILKHISSAHLIDAVLCSYRVRENSVSSNKLLNIGYQWRVLYYIEDLGLGPSTYYMTQWLIRSGAVGAYRTWRKVLVGFTNRHAWG
jgi:glycosyltransferase involved in cell wall biosynthesis